MESIMRLGLAWGWERKRGTRTHQEVGIPEGAKAAVTVWGVSRACWDEEGLCLEDKRQAVRMSEESNMVQVLILER